MERYKAVFDHLPQAALLLGSGNRIEDSNRMARDLLRGFAPDAGPRALETSGLVEWIAGEIGAFRKEDRDCCLFEKSMQSGAGRRIYRVRLSKVAPADPKTGLVLILTDITERRKALEQLGRLAAIVEYSEAAILSLDAEGRILTWNRGAEHMYGYTDEEAVGLDYLDMLPSHLEDEARKRLAEALRGHPSIRYETLHLTKSGITFPASCTLSPIEAGGRVVGVSVITRDVTERRRVEDELTRSYDRMAHLLNETVNSLSLTLEKRDLYTSGHQQRVARIACLTAEHLGMDPQEVEDIRIAALLHDIGKICVPMSILNRPARLSPSEMALVMGHSSVGLDILKNVPFPGPVGRLVFQHHERMDGSGYPSGASGEDILPGARVIAVADVLEAMSSHRPYRPALGLEYALSEFAEYRGERYDPDVCEAVRRLCEKQSVFMDKGELCICR